MKKPLIYLHQAPEVQAPIHRMANFPGHIVGALSRSHERNQFIVSKVLEDLANGEVVLIPVHFLQHAHSLKDEIEKHIENSCYTYTLRASQTKDERTSTLEKIAQPGPKVIFIPDALLGHDFNITNWTVYYKVLPLRDRYTPTGNRTLRVFVDTGFPTMFPSVCRDLELYEHLGFKVSDDDDSRTVLRALGLDSAGLQPDAEQPAGLADQKDDPSGAPETDEVG